jgi:hypothetical protein
MSHRVMAVSLLGVVGFLSGLVLWTVVPVSQGAEEGAVKTSLDKAFPRAAKCKRCHERVYEEWEASPLSRSIHSPAFRATLNEYLTFSGGRDKALCFRCHAPHVNEFPEQAETFVAQSQSGDPALDGVGCAQCHLIQHVDRTTQPPIPKYVTGKTLFGPYKDFVSNLAHQSVELDLFRKTDLCLNCHMAVPTAANLGNKNDLLGSWAASASVKAGKQCQTCHMPEQVGESANGEKKRTIANHSFPGRLGTLRQDAAKLDVVTKVTGEQTTVTVTLRNLVPHNLPTTHPGWASVALDLTIKGKNLKTVFHDQRVYGRTYADAKGEPTVFDFKAVKVLKDTVLKPEETRVETFTFPTPKDTRSFDVEVSLNYAPVTGPPAFLQRIEAESTKGAQDPVFQPIPIVSKVENIPLR